MHKKIMIDIIMGFDFGTKNIGVAIGQTLTCTVRPLTVLQSKHGIPNWNHIKNIYDIWNPGILIVGLPLKVNGGEQSITILAKRFATQLKDRLHVIVKMHDERFSTNEARLNYFYKHNCRYSGYLQDRKNIDTHAIAAGLILKSWLNDKFFK